MADRFTTIQNVPVLVCAPEGSKISSEGEALDLISLALENGAEMVLLPVIRLDETFFQLKSGLAGQILQKFVNYRRQLVILGDTSTYQAASRAFHDFVYEANHGQQIWFLPSLAELEQRLTNRKEG